VTPRHSKSKRLFRTLRDEENYILKLFIIHQPTKSDWHEQIQAVDAEDVLKLHLSGTPIVCCFLHLGHYKLNRFILRAVGIQAKSIVSNRTNLLHESQLDTDNNTFEVTQLKQACHYLKKGGWLNVAVDVTGSTYEDFTVSDGRLVRFSTGALRIAKKHNASLVAVRIDDQSKSRKCIHFSTPILINEADDFQEAAELLYQHFLPSFSKPAYQRSAYGNFVLKSACPPVTEKV
jgi:lauroyl/myristoyl acyltransferase